ncbi:MAG: zinc-dependent alcohol dehydrogenase [Candidatus Lokiarchaeota archaeon]|nr:zinc-dependent alcohol dehydrogenase [Candidatus Lokiarchaeota archaeon]
MRAAIVEEIGRISIKEVPKPTPGHEEVLVKILTVGVCHSDIHMVKNDWVKVPTPFPLGHEAIGIVEDLGPGAEKYVKKGERVILGLGGTAGAYWCGACEHCLAGKPMLCAHRKQLQGVFAEYFVVWAKALVILPDEIGNNDVPLACAGLTAYSAIKKLSKFGIHAGKTIAIIGAAGGLGHYGVQIAKALGYKVIGVDIGPEKLEFTKKMGADVVVDVNEAVKTVRKKFKLGLIKDVSASVVLASKVAGFELGLQLLRRGGVLVAVGLPALSEGSFSVNPFGFILRGLHITSCLVGNIEEMRELIQLAAEGKVKTHIGRIAKLSEINEVLEELEQGKIVGRAILEIQ